MIGSRLISLICTPNIRPPIEARNAKTADEAPSLTGARLNPDMAWRIEYNRRPDSAMTTVPRFQSSKPRLLTTCAVPYPAP